MRRCINEYLNATSDDGYGFVFAFCELVSSQTDYRKVSCGPIWGQTRQTMQLHHCIITGCDFDGEASAVCSVVMSMNVGIRYLCAVKLCDSKGVCVMSDGQLAWECITNVPHNNSKKVNHNYGLNVHVCLKGLKWYAFYILSAPEIQKSFCTYILVL